MRETRASMCSRARARLPQPAESLGEAAKLDVPGRIPRKGPGPARRSFENRPREEPCFRRQSAPRHAQILRNRGG